MILVERVPAARRLDQFDEVIAPLLFGRTGAVTSPQLTLVLSASATGRSRATGRVAGDAVVLNARDLEILALELLAEGQAPLSTVAADWLQRGLAEARERRTSVVLEGAFRSPQLVTALARQFSKAGFRTRVVAVAERPCEVRMSDASRRLHAHLRPTGQAPVPEHLDVPVENTLRAIATANVVEQVTVWDRAGAPVIDVVASDPSWGDAADRFAEAAAHPLGTLRSALWLSELRHMTRALVRERTAPRWAVDELIALHEVALAEIVPELTIPADSEASQVQEERLQATLSALRKSVSSDMSEDRTSPVLTATVDGVGLSR